jgi:hypothetical protein
MHVTSRERKNNYMDLVYSLCMRYRHTFRLFTSSEMCGGIDKQTTTQELYSCKLVWITNLMHNSFFL